MSELRLCTFTTLAIMVLAYSGVSAVQLPTHRARQPDLAIEITGLAVRSMVIPVYRNKPGSAGTGSLRRMPGWQPAAGDVPVESIMIAPNIDGDILTINLSVHLENDKEVSVGAYRLREGESATANELTKYGIEPVTFKIVRAMARREMPEYDTEPEVQNKLKAIEIIGVRRAENHPGFYKVTVRNVSTNNIAALSVYEPHTHGQSGQEAEGTPTRPLIPAGGVYTMNIHLNRRMTRTSEGSVPDPMPPKIVIGTVVFDDGSYEGEPETAAILEARRRGEKAQLTKVLGILRRAAESADQDAGKGVEAFKENIYALSKDADTAAVDEVAAHYTTLSAASRRKLIIEFEQGMRRAKEEVLMSIQRFEERRKRSPESADFQAWVSHTKQRIEAEVSGNP